MDKDLLTSLELRVETLEDSLAALEREVERMREDTRALAATIRPPTGLEQP